MAPAPFQVTVMEPSLVTAAVLCITGKYLRIDDVESIKLIISTVATASTCPLSSAVA